MKQVQPQHNCDSTRLILPQAESPGDYGPPKSTYNIAVSYGNKGGRYLCPNLAVSHP
ncbi:MAG: hypothetical protein QXR45_13500 [Candidatus Bathyarchaeia archaeon]